MFNLASKERKACSFKRERAKSRSTVLFGLTYEYFRAVDKEQVLKKSFEVENRANRTNSYLSGEFSVV